MVGRKNYDKAVREAVAEYERRTGRKCLLYVSRPGGGEPPAYAFTEKTCLGGPEALSYVEGLLAGLDQEETSDAATATG